MSYGYRETYPQQYPQYNMPPQWQQQNQYQRGYQPQYQNPYKKQYQGNTYQQGYQNPRYQRPKTRVNYGNPPPNYQRNTVTTYPRPQMNTQQVRYGQQPPPQRQIRQYTRDDGTRYVARRAPIPMEHVDENIAPHQAVERRRQVVYNDDVQEEDTVEYIDAEDEDEFVEEVPLQGQRTNPKPEPEPFYIGKPRRSQAPEEDEQC